jgi:hypothetical protein
MGIILRTGLGTKKIVLVIPIGKKVFRTIKEEEGYKGIVKVEKTDSQPVNNKWLIEQYRFSYYDENEELRSYFLGNPSGEKEFYLQEMRSLKAGQGTNGSPLKLISEKAKVRLANIFCLKRKKENCHSFERNLFYLWNYTKNYLKESGIERMITQAEFELVDTAEIDMKVGWRDINRDRKIEQYLGNIIERKKHYTIPERLAGTLSLEYPLNEPRKK